MLTLREPVPASESVLMVLLRLALVESLRLALDLRPRRLHPKDSILVVEQNRIPRLMLRQNFAGRCCAKMRLIEAELLKVDRE